MDEFLRNSLSIRGLVDKECLKCSRNYPFSSEKSIRRSTMVVNVLYSGQKAKTHKNIQYSLTHERIRECFRLYRLRRQTSHFIDYLTIIEWGWIWHEEFWRSRWIKPSEICRILRILRKPNSIIALSFIQNISFAQSCKPARSHFALC